MIFIVKENREDIGKKTGKLLELQYTDNISESIT